MSRDSLITIERFEFGKKATIGRVFVGDSFVCNSLEDVRRDVKIWGETCIPAGRYPLSLRKYGRFYTSYSERWPWHDQMIEILGVKNFSDILIHAGNHNGHTAGCPLVGEWKGESNFIHNSRKAYERLYRAAHPAISLGNQFIRIMEAANGMV